MIKFDSNYQNNPHFQIFYKGKVIQGEINTEFIGVEYDKHLELENTYEAYNTKTK
jgi:hypothetical protein